MNLNSLSLTQPAKCVLKSFQLYIFVCNDCQMGIKKEPKEYFALYLKYRIKYKFLLDLFLAKAP